MNYTINAGDDERVREFAKRYLGETGSLERTLAHEQRIIVTAEDDGRLIGTCYGAPKEHEMRIHGIAVDLDGGCARKGIGSMLLERFEAITKRNGYDHISVGSADDERVVRFYEKHGYLITQIVTFDPSGRETDRERVSRYQYNGSQGDRFLVMEKELRATGGN